MKKQLLSCILTAAMFTGGALGVYGAEFKTQEKSVTFEVGITPEKKASMIVVKKGKSIDNNDNIFAVKEGLADENGKVVFEFDMYDGAPGNLADGEYDVYVKEEGKDKVKYYFAYVSETTKTTLKTDLETSFSNTVSGSSNELALKGAGFNLEGYANLADKSKAMQFAEEYINPGDGVEEYAVAFNLAVGLEELKEDKDVGAVLSEVNLEFEGKKYNDITDVELKTWIDSCFEDVSQLSGVEDFISQYEASNILNTVNKTRHTGMESILDKYKTELGIENSAEYNAYLALYSKTNANAALETAFATSPVMNVTALKNAIGAASSAGVVVTPSGSSSSGGTGGGSAGSGNKFPGIQGGVPSATVNTNVSDGKFSDLGNVKWAEDAINEMAKAEIVSGDGTGKFRPNDTMKREEFVKMLVLAVGKYDETAECNFEDVPEDAWYYRYVASAYNAGIVYGVSDTHFGVGNELTRQDMAVICCRAAEISGGLSEVREEKVFDDSTQISGYAVESVNKLYKSGNISGIDDYNFSPLTKATRAQGALIIYNLFLK